MRNKLEIDKVFAGAHESQSTDSGVSSRMLSYFLNWLSSRDVSSSSERRTFVMVTMNRATGVPPELMRRGRFDEIWCTDLPDTDEREDILRIHLAKRGVPPEIYGKSLKTVCGAMEGFSGAEIEEVARSARTTAYDARMHAWETAGASGPKPTKEQIRPTLEELAGSASILTPLSRLAATDVEEIRSFCQSRARPVSGQRVHDGGVKRKARNVSTAKATAVDPQLQ